jgi:NADH-quinone oxidoreductase subunit M
MSSACSFIVDIIYSRTKTRYLDQLGGITQSTPHLSVYFMILLLGSVALPLTNGFVGEFLLLSSVFQYNGWLGAMAGLTIILGSVYMLRLFQKSMFGPKSKWVEGFQDLTASERAVLLTAGDHGFLDRYLPKHIFENNRTCCKPTFATGK